MKKKTDKTNPGGIIVLGSVNVDLIVKSARIPQPGETVIEGTFFQASGGKGANQAVAAARCHRAPVTFIAAVGDDAYGAEALNELQQEQINCTTIRVVKESATGIALIMVDQRGENCISVASGANARLTPNDIAAVDERSFDEATIFLASLEVPIETVKAGLQRAKAAGLTTILNPAPAHSEVIDAGLLSFVDILTPNQSELALLSGQLAGNTNAIAKNAQTIRSHGCEHVIVTLGPAGILVIGPDPAQEIPAFPVTPIDTTAAGDAFNGALAVALAEDQSLETACRFACAAAGLSVTHVGAQPSLPHRADVDELLAESK